jgi:hypothetical protein
MVKGLRCTSKDSVILMDGLVVSSWANGKDLTYDIVEQNWKKSANS